MSETIEATATPVTVPAETAVASAGALPRVPARDLVRLTQGLYFIFWGLLVTVLVGVQTAVLFRIRAFAEAFLIGGVLATLMGSWRLRQARFATLPAEGPVVLWRKRSNRLLGLGLLLTYFCVLFYLWRRAPTSLYLQLNAAAFAATGVAYLTMLNRSVTALAAVVGREEMALESRVFSAANIALMILPFGAAGIYVTLAARLNQSTPLDELALLMQHVNWLVMVVMLLPLSLTLSLVWAAKDILVQQLVSFDNNRAGQSEPPA